MNVAVEGDRQQQHAALDHVLRLNVEAKTRTLMEQKRDEVVTFIRE